MAVVYIQKQPDGFTPDIYDDVNGRMGTEHEPPEGLIFHSLGKADDGVWRMVDVWESREAADRFRDERLVPAIRAALSDAGMNLEDMPEPETMVYDTYDAMVGAAARTA
jgi:hypothetical protein